MKTYNEKMENIYCPFVRGNIEIQLIYVDEGPGNDILKSFSCNALNQNKCSDNGKPCRILQFLGEDISEII